MKKFRDKLKGIIRPPPSSSSASSAAPEDKDSTMSVSDHSQHNPLPPPPPGAGGDGGDGLGAGVEVTADSAVPIHERDESSSMDVSPSLPASANKKRVPIVNNPEGAGVRASALGWVGLGLRLRVLANVVGGGCGGCGRGMPVLSLVAVVCRR